MEYEKRIKEIEETIEKLEIEKALLREKNVGYFIGVRYVGDGDYWDEYLVPLGKITEAEAYKWVEDNNDYCTPEFWMGSTAPYFEVSFEDYKKYQTIANLKTILVPEAKYKEEIDSINKRILEIKSELYEELGIKHQSFVHVSLN